MASGERLFGASVKQSMETRPLRAGVLGLAVMVVGGAAALPLGCGGDSGAVAAHPPQVFSGTLGAPCGKDADCPADSTCQYVSAGEFPGNRCILLDGIR